MTGSLLDRYTADQIRAAIADPATPTPVISALDAGLIDELQDWTLQARPNQLPPPGDWLVWLILAGRGWGKTRTGAEFAKDGHDQSLLRRERSLWAFVAATSADGRDTMIEGDSGLLSILPPSALRGGAVDTAWNRSLGELYLANGSKAKIYSSEKPGQLRGPQHDGAWGDEPAKWNDADRGDVTDTTWSNLMLGLRRGTDPRCVLTTTPKRVRLLVGTKDRPGIMKAGTTHTTHGTTYDNLANLAPTFRAQILAKYEGTRLGRQELMAEVLDDVEGALWSLARIDAHRVDVCPPLRRVVTAIDPAVTSGEDADDTGIVVAGLGFDGHGYVLADKTCHESPKGWAKAAVDAHDEFEGDRIVGEVNNGGDLVETVLRSVDPAVPYRKVSASRGKRVRAEPIAALYEQGRVHHVGSFGDLEDEMCTWEPESGVSPDRMDALVWALTDLMLGVERRELRYRGAA